MIAPSGPIEVPARVFTPETETAIPPRPPLDPPKPGLRRDVFTLDEGDAILQWPSDLSPESFEDFQGWLQLVERKARRVAGLPPVADPK